ncbi:acyl-CoA dehydrogenase family protein [Sphingopyxis kveilinensis]|uniref:acyl-CoA dehydrogenase family protein n=1 Tax=Sphingopyxis kveilinensis TaxID=3114367 RepID=UPI0030CA6B33
MTSPTTYLTEERLMIQELARQFAMNEVLPLANRLDPEQGDIPQSLRDQMADLGFFGILIPEEYGGLGLGCFEYCLVTEELSRAWMSVGSLIARGNGLLGAELMAEEKRRDLLPRIAKGELLGSFAMSEPDAGSDAANISCRARRDGGEWVINGNKYWCTFADGADYICVVARTEVDVDSQRRHKGLSVFMIPKPRGELPSGVKGSPIPKIGYFGWKTWELAFDECRVPAEAMIGEEGKAFYLFSNMLEKARAHTAARAIGVARAALEDAMAYARQRVQFGRPIAEFQAIRFKIATMATEIEAARQLLYHVCDKIDTGVRCDTEASMVKYYASEIAERVTSEGMQILGGAGYTKLHAMERHWRDARLTKIFEGTSEIQQRIISDNLLGKIPS